MARQLEADRRRAAIDLASFEAIREALTLTGKRKRGRPRNAKPKLKRNAVRNKRCRCGKCVTCRENARWDEIFRAKFEDPTYYSRERLPRSVSALSEFA